MFFAFRQKTSSCARGHSQDVSNFPIGLCEQFVAQQSRLERERMVVYGELVEQRLQPELQLDEREPRDEQHEQVQRVNYPLRCGGLVFLVRPRHSIWLITAFGESYETSRHHRKSSQFYQRLSLRFYSYLSVLGGPDTKLHYLRYARPPPLA